MTQATLATVDAFLGLSEVVSAPGISPGTVKRHTHSIYGKLAVSSRRDAVAKATGLGLLRSE